MGFKIRSADLSDLDFLHQCQLSNALETEDLALDQNRCRQGVLALLTGQRPGSYWIAEDQDRRVGCLLLQSEWSDWRNGEVWWIHSVYVLPEMRKKGVFHALYSSVQNRATRDSQCFGLRLFVDKRNRGARATYVRSGMNADHYELFEWMKH